MSVNHSEPDKELLIDEARSCIRNAELVAAKEILTTLLTHYPQDIEILLLLSYTEINQAENLKWLRRVKKIDPGNEDAGNRYREIIQGESLPYTRKQRQNKKRPKRFKAPRPEQPVFRPASHNFPLQSPPQRDLLSTGLFLFLGIIVLIVFFAAILLVSSNLSSNTANNEPTDDQMTMGASPEPATALFALPSVEPTFTQQPDIPASTQEVEPEPDMVARALRIQENSLRFHDFPVYIYMNTDEVIWKEALSAVVNELDRYIPVEVTPHIELADIIVRVMPTLSNVRLSGDCSDTYRLVGCGTALSYINESLPVDDPNYFDMHGDVWVLATALNPDGVLLHEILHAMGIEKHSAGSTDIMYSYTNQAVILQPGDIALIKEVYPELFEE